MSYKRPIFLFNAHLETIYPALFRKVALASYTRERIPTHDNDFLDIDWLKNKSNKLAIISHGLEGNSQRAYIKGMANLFFANGFDVLAWNYRGCSEEMNKQRIFYHSGATYDLDAVVKHALQHNYQSIVLIGFSLGGNLTLKYIGEHIRDERITKAITFSVPLNLHDSCIQISKPNNWMYTNRFLTSLKKKVTSKALTRNDIDIENINSIKTLQQFDDRYTSVLHGYKNAIDYYTQCSAIAFTDSIRIPTLIVNAKNDPFLGEGCYPYAKLKNNPFILFETPEQGGHVGFSKFDKNGTFWSEERALQFALL
jgi:uncharacterized protein